MRERDFRSAIRQHVAPLELDGQREAELVDELNDHLCERYCDLLASRLSEAEAREAVLLELREERLPADLVSVLRSQPARVALGDESGGSPLGGLVQDLLHGLRLLRLNPGFALAAVASLALGVGANTAIFQLIDAVRLLSLPVPAPEQLSEVKIAYMPNGRSGRFSGPQANLTYAIYRETRERQQGLTDLAAWGRQQWNVHEGGESKYALGLWASGNLFQVLQIRPFLGRTLSEADDQPACGSRAAVISYAFWQQEYGGNASIVGARLTVERQPFKIVGVMPPEFFGMEVGKRFDIALPLCAEPAVSGERANLKKGSNWWLSSIGRLKPGWNVERLNAQLASISPALFAAAMPPEYGKPQRDEFAKFRLGAVTASTGFSQLRREYSDSLWLLMAISGAVLLIACANLANLMLARATAREREMAVRLALGASRSRLVRQLLAESLLIALAGTASGVAIAQGLSRGLVSLLDTAGSKVFMDLALDWRVLLFGVALSVLTCLIFGLAPAIHASRTAPAEAMKASARGSSGARGAFEFRRLLAASQVALSLVLLVGALLFIGTLRNLLSLDPGFEAERIVTADVDLSPLQLPVARRSAYRRQLVESVRSIPGVESAAEVSMPPLSGNQWNQEVSVPESKRRLDSCFNSISDGFFRTMGTPLLAGRDFGPEDTVASPKVAIVNQTFARQFFGGRNPVGNTFVRHGYNEQKDIFQIVGLVKDTKYTDLREEFLPIAYLAVGQEPSPDAESLMMIRAARGSDILPALRNAIANTDPALNVRFGSLRNNIRDGLVRERLMAMLAGFFGVLATVLATIGIYGVIAYMVARRRNEIGVRIALGASRANIVALVASETATLVLAGLATGIALALLAAPASRALLYGMKPSDPGALALAGLLMLAAGMLASVLPALSAAAVQPIAVLREE
jgi:putative ABC transport system permease protein